MLLLFVLITVSVFPGLISGTQFPTINGVIGGVPSSDARTSKILSASGAFANDASPTTPGKLRVVENSGVCGAFVFHTTYPLSCSQLGRDYAGRLSGFWIW
jgi:hypothetical protein